MDDRVSLKPGARLVLTNNEGSNLMYTIISEVGRGSSCIVYEASYLTNTGDNKFVRIKECYPYKLNITRSIDGALDVSSEDKALFVEEKDKFKSDFSLSNRLFYESRLYDSFVNALDIHECNNSIYIVLVFSSQDTFVTKRPSSLKACVELICNVASIIERIHSAGYLYLDIKPDNVLYINDGVQDRIQLFDFDSLIPFNHNRNEVISWQNKMRLSYSKGFAAIELQMAKYTKISPATDVFGVGALLFYMLFSKTPNALQCETEASFSLEDIQYNIENCDDQLLMALTDFFHHTLANYQPDRYQSMEEVISGLRGISEYSDTKKKRVFSSIVTCEQDFVGRSDEIQEIDRILNSSCHCLFITGMGGIGKSTLIREYLFTMRSSYDCCIYLVFRESIKNIIINDNTLSINKVWKADIEKEEVYFKRKLKELKNLVSEKTLLVIDNFYGVIDEDFVSLLDLKWKIVVVSRQKYRLNGSQTININKIQDENDLISLFESNLGRRISVIERPCIEHIIGRVAGHTLVVGLIAKQIASSHISIKQAVDLATEKGFSDMATETVAYEKDRIAYSDTIGSIIDALFSSNKICIEKKTVLKIVSLLSISGMDIQQLHFIMEWKSFQNVNELEKDGWLIFDGDSISMHPVIQEVVNRWEWEKSFLEAAQKFLTYFYVEIRIESTKNDYPKHLYDMWFRIKDSEKKREDNRFQKFFSQRYVKWFDKFCDQNGIVGIVTRERFFRIEDGSPADLEKISKLVYQAKEIIEQCKKIKVLREDDTYVNLLYTTVLNVSPASEEYILRETQDIFNEDVNLFILSGASELLENSEKSNPITILKLIKKVVCLYAEKEEFEAAEELLQKGFKIVKRAGVKQAYAHYYDMVSDFYDIKLNGAYDPESIEEQELLEKLYEYNNKSLRYAKKDIQYDGDHIYLKNLLAKATFLIRSSYSNPREIQKIIEDTKSLIEDNTQQYAFVRLQYYMVCAWYYGLILEDVPTTRHSLGLAKELYDTIGSNDLDRIDCYYVPAANICLELKQYKISGELLLEAKKICEKYAGAKVYLNRKTDILGYMLDVALFADAYKLASLIVEEIDIVNEENKSYGIYKEISEDIRLTIKDNII